MRQKVGKERSQEGCAPLANPRRFLACPLRKFGPSPIPPSGSAAGRQGRRCKTSRRAQPKIRPDSPYDGPELHPAKARCFSFTLERPSASSGHKNCTSHACSHTAASKRRAADATPGGRKTAIRNKPRSKIARVAATPRGASHIHFVLSLCRWRQLVFQKTIMVRAPWRFILFRRVRNS